MWIIQTLEGKVCCFDLQNLDDDDGFMVFSIFKKKMHWAVWPHPIQNVFFRGKKELGCGSRMTIS